MKRPKISRRAETRPYGRVSAPTGNCRKFLTQLARHSIRSCTDAVSTGGPQPRQPTTTDRGAGARRVAREGARHGGQKSVKSDELPEPVRQREAELDRLRVCTHCGSSGVVRYGKSAGLCRFRCRSASCGRTFHALTGTHLAGLRHKSKWSVFEACLRDRRLTRHQSAERCGISYRTAFLWRHRFLGKQ